MCGIIGYIGDSNSAKYIIEGLINLEYRGYDSFGIAIKENNNIQIEKQIGAVSSPSDKEKILEIQNKEANIAIGHTRWATHGQVSQYNSHPHFSKDNEFVIVHNGIIENYLELKEQLIKKGYTFTSDTDSEVVAHLIKDNYKDSFLNAFKNTLDQIEGRYAIVAISKHDNQILGARRGSPLIIGKAENSYFIASDIPAFLRHTNEVMYLDDNQLVVLDQNQANFYEISTLTPIEKRLIKIDLDPVSAEKGDFEHFMLKEIFEQKQTIMRSINQEERDIQIIAQAIKNAKGTYLIGCGTSYKVCQAATYTFAKVAKHHINTCPASEFPAYMDFIKEGSLVIAISQSGETADTLDALEKAKEKGASILSIINVKGSSMDKISDYTLLLKSGIEKAVASTKATTAQMSILTLLAYALKDDIDSGKVLLAETSSKINDMLNPRYEQHIKGIAEKFYNEPNIYIIGKAENYPMALESAIKLQEVTYIHAEGFAAGELKHGPLALIQKDVPVIALCSNDNNFSDTISNCTEIKSRGGLIIGVSPINDPIFDYWIKVPDANAASHIVNIIPIQILSYHLALLKENNPDKPRNLAKSVTVK